MDNFRKVYDRELENYEDGLERLILSSTDVRMFVYEVCKACLAADSIGNIISTITDRIEELESENENLHIENDTLCQRLQNEQKCTACMNKNTTYDEAIKRIETLWGAEPGTPDGEELDELIEWVRDYEQEFCPVPLPEEGDRP